MSLGVGGVVIMNIMLVSVAERTAEIGIRLALGARKRDVARQFLLEAAALSLCGGLLGLLAGAGITWAVRDLVGFPARITPGIVAASLAMSTLVGLAAGLPAGAPGGEPAGDRRPEGGIAMGALLKRSALLRALGPETVRFAFRSIAAQKLRSFLTLLGILAGVATVIAMVSFVAGFNQAITGAFAASGTSLVQFQKFEPRFGGPPELIPEEQRAAAQPDPGGRRRPQAPGHPGRGGVPGARPGGEPAHRGPVKNRQGDGGQRPGRPGGDPRLRRGQQPEPWTTAASSATRTWPTRRRVCVIGADLVKSLFPARDPVGQEVLIQGVAFRVIGILEQRGSQFGGSADSLLLVPLTCSTPCSPR